MISNYSVFLVHELFVLHNCSSLVFWFLVWLDIEEEGFYLDLGVNKKNAAFAYVPLHYEERLSHKRSERLLYSVLTRNIKISDLPDFCIIYLLVLFSVFYIFYVLNYFCIGKQNSKMCSVAEFLYSHTCVCRRFMASFSLISAFFAGKT